MVNVNEGPKIRGVIFDFGNVIYRFDLRRFTAALSQLCGLSSEEIHHRVFEDSGLEWDYMAGNIDSSRFLEEVSRICGHRFEEETFARTFSDIFTPIESTQTLIRQLKPAYKLGLISDTSQWHFERAISHCTVFPLFDAVILSYVERRLKPDRRMFEHCLAQLELKPEDCVFIDDRAPNTAGARAMGLRAITYRGHEALMNELQQLGIEA
jgi:putative hydrolase of the HAD superfamily